LFSPDRVRQNQIKNDMSIKLVNHGRILTERDLQDVEGRLGIQFPMDYRAFLLKQNGGEPDSPTAFSVTYEDGDIADVDIVRFLSVDSSEDDLVSIIEFHRNVLGLPGSLVPIAEAFCEDYLLVCVSGEAKGRIFFWWIIEEGFDGSHFLPVANSFDDLWHRLHPFDGSGS
jgi:hypothetical protein